MAAVPDSRLRLQNSQLDFLDVLNDMRERLINAGVDLDRVEFQGYSERQKYLASYAEVDIVLDTHPYPGGTTTVEALWMGVPTITMTGGTMLARQGESILHAVGIPQCVAGSEDEFLAIAIRMATDINELAVMRQTLRALASKSILFDARRFSDNLVNAFKLMKLASQKTDKFVNNESS
jgi:predicted O-linked N-acetylglucosamine transferase (SPINDLY family)